MASERQAQEAALKFQTFFDQSVDGVSMLDPISLRFEAANAAMAELTLGVPDVARFLETTPRDWLADPQPNGLSAASLAQKMAERALEDGSVRFEALHQQIDTNTLWWAQVSVKRLELVEGLRLLCQVRDISEGRRYQEKLHKLAFSDPLTQLPNRAATLDWLQQWKLREDMQCLALVNLDLDGFQQINDSFGYTVGDRVLKAVASLLPTLAPPGAWVARLEGDGFVVLLPGLHGGAALTWVTEMQAGLADGVRNLDLMPTRLSCCAGIAVLAPLTLQPAEELLQCANTALSQARRRGYGQLDLYDTAMSRRIERDLMLEQCLEACLRDQGAGLQLVYQAQVDRNGALVGAEALLRWSLTDGSAVRPDEFIPLAERTGHIQAIGRWVIETGCRQMALWQQADLVLPSLSLNVSPMQLDQQQGEHSLFEQLQIALSTWKVDPRLLELEITETALFLDREEAMPQLRKITDLGICFAIDDFGTGFASIEMLKSFPLSKLKIDKAFVDHVVADDQDQAIVAATVLLGRRMGLTVLAEGVETTEQWKVLANIGCDSFQGYRFARPMSADQFANTFLVTSSSPSGPIAPN